MLLCDESLPVLIKNRRHLVRRQELRRTQKENEGYWQKEVRYTQKEKEGYWQKEKK